MKSSVEAYLTRKTPQRPTLDAMVLYLARTTGYSPEFLRALLTVDA